MNNENNYLSNMDMMLAVITILSFVLQLQNNDELQKQSSNDDVLRKLHNDVMTVLEDNRKLFNVVIEQNNEILNYLKGDNDNYEKK